eukprot:4777864-Ditylum_brightwellii.AAC.1
MEMIQFGMENTLVCYRDKYFNYKGAAKGDNLTIEDVALAIGGYESAFLADLVASYLLEMTGDDYLQFTTEIWNPSNETRLTMKEEEE